MANLVWLSLMSLLSCGPKSIPQAPAPKPIPISYGVTFSIDDAESYDPELLLAFKSSIRESLSAAQWEAVTLNVEPYTDVYAIEHQGFPIDGSSILSIPDVQIHLYYAQKSQQLLLSLEFLYQEWFTQTRVELASEAGLDVVAQASIEALLNHVNQAQLDGKIPYGLSVMLSMSPKQDTLEHHTAERYRYLRWQGLTERLWSSGVPPYLDKPYGNPNLSVINTIEIEALAVLGTLQSTGLACRIVGKSRTTQRFHCVLPPADPKCVDKTIQWSLSARGKASGEVCVGDDCQSMACDDKYCCLSLNLDADADQSQLCRSLSSDDWFLGLDDCQLSIF